MSFGDAIQRRADLLRKRGADVDRIFWETSRGATIQAIAAAQDKTPATMDDLAGTDTRSGGMKEQWAVESELEPEIRPHLDSGTDYVTYLNNNAEYASYVDQGHQMHRHFVPGLILDSETGKLERVPPDEGGIMVGTKTSYVPGIFAVEAGRDAFEDAAVRALNKAAQEVFRDG